MRKYKHKPSGIIVQGVVGNEFFCTQEENVHIPALVIQTGNDWEEIKEKNWEITAIQFKDRIETYEKQSGNIIEGRDNWVDKCLHHSLPTPHIYSVKRLSDGVEFHVDGYMIYKNEPASAWCNKEQACPISEFEIIDNQIYVNGHIERCRTSKETIEDWVKVIPEVKPVLFTTEDGVDIYDGDQMWWLHPIYEKPFTGVVATKTVNYFTNGNYSKKFSTKEAAEKYIAENKPQFSYKDIEKMINSEAIAYVRKDEVYIRRDSLLNILSKRIFL